MDAMKDETRLRRLAAATALIADCAGATDDERFEDWSACFTADCLYRITTREACLAGWPAGLMHCEGAAMLRDRILSMRHANIFEAHHYRHMVSATRLAPAGSTPPAGGFRVHTNFNVTRIMAGGETTLFATGFYDDVMVETDAGLRLAERTVVLDSSRVDTLIVIPI